MESVWTIVAIGAGLALIGLGVRIAMRRVEKRRK